jgi:hypothetical protein
VVWTEAAPQAAVAASGRRTIMHPMFVALFIGTDTEDLLIEEHRQRCRARRRQATRVIRAAA